jgi:hypothetical protein
MPLTRASPLWAMDLLSGRDTVNAVSMPFTRADPLRETPFGTLATSLFCRLANLDTLTSRQQRTQRRRSPPRNGCSNVPFPRNIASLAQSANLPLFCLLYEVSASSFHRPTRPDQHRLRHLRPTSPACKQKSCVLCKALDPETPPLLAAFPIR